VNGRQTILQVEERMKEFAFDQGEKWKYDPHHIISNKRGYINYAPYFHERKLVLEKMENQETWPGNTMYQRIDIQTILLREKSLKINIPKQIDVDIEDSQF